VTDLILHHYPSSPFSEKVRLVLGFKGLDWKSVMVPTMLPKPDVVALTGGYRRTPFLQIGADIYCDSALMCRVIERIAPRPSIYPPSAGGAAQIVSQWADSALFWVAIPYTMQPAGIEHIMQGASPEVLKAFGADRAAMTTGMRRATPADAAAQLKTYLGWIEQQLGDGRRFLCGEAASIADFSVAQSIWFIRRAPPVATVLALQYPDEQAASARAGDPYKFSDSTPTSGPRVAARPRASATSAAIRAAKAGPITGPGGQRQNHRGATKCHAIFQFNFPYPLV